MTEFAKVFDATSPEIAERHADGPRPDAAVRSPWDDPDTTLLRNQRPAPPKPPIREVFGPCLAGWIEQVASAKGAPPDYVLAAILAGSAGLVGNARWVTIWPEWSEPPCLWCMSIGTPSMNKSPATDSVTIPIRKVEQQLRLGDASAVSEWEQKAEVAKIADKLWKAEVQEAINEGKVPPAKPQETDIGPAPHLTRLIVNDGTVERIGSIISKQPKGFLQMRDELQGWLEGMTRYSGGATDRPFWLEAFGGRGYTVERVGRETLTVSRLTISTLGNIVPHNLDPLLKGKSDDGLIARFLPFWPEPVPIQGVPEPVDNGVIDILVRRLAALEMVKEGDDFRPFFLGFDDAARSMMTEFRRHVRELEQDADGLLISFLGKMPGVAARISLILAILDYAAEDAPEPKAITAGHFGRAAHLVDEYLIPMARRSYHVTAEPEADRLARALLAEIRKAGWREFTRTDVARCKRPMFEKRKDADAAVSRLVEAGWVVPKIVANSRGPGRPTSHLTVNPRLWEVQA